MVEEFANSVNELRGGEGFRDEVRAGVQDSMTNDGIIGVSGHEDDFGSG